MAIIKRDFDSSFLAYKLFGNRITVTFNAGEWFFSFWFNRKNINRCWANGGFGFWRINLWIDLDQWNINGN